MTRSTYHSNAIEGSTLSYAETYAILFNDNSMKVTATACELYEAINHKCALSRALENPEEELSERLIKDIAQAINHNINEVGGYRTVPVFIAAAEHIPPAPNQINQQTMQLVYERNQDFGLDPFCVRRVFTCVLSASIPLKTATAEQGAFCSTGGLCVSK